MRTQRHSGLTVLGLAALALLMGGTRQATAAIIIYSVGGSGFSFQADTVTNNAFAGTLNVPDGGSVLGTLQTGTFTVGDSGIFSGSSPFTLPETFTANGVTSSVQLQGTLTITPTVDTLLYINGTPTVLTLSNGQTLTVTPRPQTLSSANLGTTPYTLQATFSVSPAPVPEPSSLALLGIAGVGLAGWHRWRKRVVP